MSVYLKQGSVLTEIGPGALFHSLFSTIAVRLEQHAWGSRFPVVMNKLYEGKIESKDAEAAFAEISRIREGLAGLAPGQVIWDADDLSKVPPYGKHIGTHVRSCADYWMTTTGRNLVDEIIDNLESLREFGGTLEVHSSYDLRRA